MKLHALAGLPRSGSTLLANVLSQHPDIYVSGTSALPICVEVLQGTLTSRPEVKSDLANVPGAYENYLNAMRGLIDGWYSHRPESIVFDKARNWCVLQLLLEQLSPGSITVLCVRDPRDVVASIERVHRRTGLFNSPVAPTLQAACEALLNPDGGMLGGPMKWIEDAIRRGLPNIIPVRYETFCADPTVAVSKIISAIGAETHEFDYEDVQNSASDLDALYHGKFPHDGSGPIKPNESTWADVIDKQTAASIAASYPLFMQTFGY